MQNILLSIIVISHNQKKELQRCVESILAQQIPFAYEIILSDDRSSDGTFELAQEYALQYPTIIQASQCNSDECNPANNSQRSGWNRCNGYRLATGKYIAHVDADDYFREGSTVYQKQVEMLESHPECSLCMQNVWILEEGAKMETGRPWFAESKIQEGAILDAQSFIAHDFFILNQAFVARRNTSVDPTLLYGKRYVDSVITYHHVQFGKVMCINNCDYIYMKHDGAVTTSLTKNDQMVLWCLGIYIPVLVPSLQSYFYNTNLKSILQVVKLALHDNKLTEKQLNSIKDLDVYIYNVFNRKLAITDYIRLYILNTYLVLLIRANIKMKLAYKLLGFLLL